MPDSIMYGNHELPLKDLLRLTTICGPVGEDDGDPDALFFRFERPMYTRDEVLELVQIIARNRPDECEMSDEDLRIWWD